VAAWQNFDLVERATRDCLRLGRGEGISPMTGPSAALTSTAALGLAPFLRQRSPEAIRLGPGFDDVRLIR